MTRKFKAKAQIVKMKKEQTIKVIENSKKKSSKKRKLIIKITSEIEEKNGEKMIKKYGAKIEQSKINKNL